MLHYTINTGHTRRSPRSEVGDDVLEILAPMLAGGSFTMPNIRGYSCWVTVDNGMFLASVLRKTDPKPGDRSALIHFAVARDKTIADRLWPTMEKFYLDMMDKPGFRGANFKAPHRPASEPWTSVIVFEPNLEECQWLGDFERCLAWTFLEKIGAPASQPRQSRR